MQKIKLLITFFGFLILAGCGQTGPLYLPAATTTTAPVTTDAIHGPLQAP